MKSEILKEFGMPFVQCEIEAATLDDDNLPVLLFRSQDNSSSYILHLDKAASLRHRLEHAGEPENAQEIDRHIAKARRLSRG